MQAVAYDGTYEDLFFFIERLIKNAAGEDIAGRLHTARSRNDIDMTMYRIRQREFVAAVAIGVMELRAALLDLADRHQESVYAAHTHTQPAQPSTIAHYLMAVVEQLERDTTRLAAAYESTNRNPLGACAITGTGFPIGHCWCNSTLPMPLPRAMPFGRVSLNSAASTLSSITRALVTSVR